MKTPPRSGREALVGPWLFFRYMVIGTYVGVATVFGYAWWFMFYEGGPQISWYQLVSMGRFSGASGAEHFPIPQTHFHQCSAQFPEVGCEIFSNHFSKTATTMSLSILVGE